MLPIATNTKLFAKDQSTAFTVEYWNTPFTPLYGNVASGGIKMWVKQPTATGTFLSVDTLGRTTSAATDGTYGTALAAAFFTGNGTLRTPDYASGGGRTANLLGYWAGGAPSQHGVSTPRQVAYLFRCHMRSATARGWWNSNATPSFSLAVAGNGFIRIDKRVSSTVTTVLNTFGTSTPKLTESQFLASGYLFSSVISDMADGDYFDMVYVQNGETWGGFVVKAVSGSTQTLALAQAAPVAGCGIFDDDVTPAAQTLQLIKQVNVERNLNATSTATFSVPLINAATDDTVGWQYVKASGTDPGLLRMYYPGTSTIDLKRGRLVRIKTGFVNEQYTSFVGFVDDITEVSTGVATVKCVSFEQRVLDQFVKNYPDKISYMAFGFYRGYVTEPVYDIPAYDNWPIEFAVRDLLVRAGIEESRTLSPLQRVLYSSGTLTTVAYNSVNYNKLRAQTLNSANLSAAMQGLGYLRAARQPKYGNYGTAFTESMPADDAYLFPPENTREIWAQLKELTDRIGYDLFFDEDGDVVLRGRNNPHYVLDFDAATFAGSPTLYTNPSAYSGTYIQYSGTVNGGSAITKNVRGARIDLCMPRGSLATWTYTVKRVSDSVVVASGTLNPSDTSDYYFYDFRTSINGTNTTVVTLWSGPYNDYTVELVGSGAGTRKLDCFFIYHTDPSLPGLPNVLATDVNALEVSAQSTMDEMRNHVLIVGARKAVVTDSEKLNTNPENPDAEFVVANAVDVDSIVNPSASNYIGYAKESIIYDSKISDQDFAEYLARVFIYRQRIPQPNAPIRHTLLPVVQVRDPVYAAEIRHGSIDTQTVLYVTQITHQLDVAGSAITQLTTTSYPEFAGYEPRDDVNIDTYYDGNPVYNMAVSYLSVDNTTQTNLSPDQAYLIQPSQMVETSALSVTGSPAYIDMASKAWPPAPGTVQLIPAGSVSTTATSATYSPPIVVGTYIYCPPKIVSLDKTGSHTTGVQGRTHTINGGWTGWSDITEVTGATTLNTYYTFDTENGAVKVTVPNPRLPGTDQYEVKIWYNKGYDGYDPKTKVDGHPYYHHFNVDYRISTGERRIYLPWNVGDKSSLYDRQNTQFKVRYYPLGPVDGSFNFTDPYTGRGAPFYDPYTSEIGQLVSVKFDALVSGKYRVSIRELNTDQVVAWLTTPTAEATDENAHWTYMTAGPSKQYFWDGVDQLGTWNANQSSEYAAFAHGAYEMDQEPVIGSGFYVWNQERESGRLGRRALIAGLRDSNSNKPVFGHGAFSTWYILVEAQSEVYTDSTTGAFRDLRVDSRYPDAATKAKNGGIVPSTTLPKLPLVPRVTGTATGVGSTTTLVDSGKSWVTNQWAGHYLTITAGTNAGKTSVIASNNGTTLTVTTAFPSSTDGTSVYQIESRSALVYTHLSEPTRVGMEVFDNTSGFSETDWDAGVWQATQANSDSADTDGTINNSKPVKVRFEMIARPGHTSIWKPGGNSLANEVAVKLIRHAHLRATIFDQIIKFAGRSWATSGTGNSRQERSVYSRRLTNDLHTIAYTDDNFRKGSSFKRANGENKLEWLFIPKYFRKKFRFNENEELRFGDYLQLEEVPGWNPAKDLGSAWSILNIAFMNYLFYLSAYTQDRSGRFSWCVNRAFLDKAKIIKNAYADWWDAVNNWTGGAAPTAASSSTYRNGWPEDWYNHRRSVITRQWTDEKLPDGTLWQTSEKNRWGFTGPTTPDVGYLLLRHKWKDHDPYATTLAGTTWSTLGLSVDNYSDNLQNSGAQGAEWNQLARQLGPDNSASGYLDKWTWELLGYKTLWVPCISRDFHPFYLLPPMSVKISGNMYLYEYVSGHYPNIAEVDVWSAKTRDMTEGTLGNKWFWRGQLPTGATDNEIGYERQDEMVHWEDLRGIYARGKTENAIVKVTPVQPYYINTLGYNSMSVQIPGGNNGRDVTTVGYTLSSMASWFHMKFRSEYLWESAGMFPVTQNGSFYPAAFNSRLNQTVSSIPPTIYWDSGAWTGWKDDKVITTPGDETDVNYRLQPTSQNQLTMPQQTIAVGPLLSVTKDMIFHLVLVNERRLVPAF